MKPSLASAPTVITCHSNADWDALSSMIDRLGREDVADTSREDEDAAGAYGSAVAAGHCCAGGDAARQWDAALHLYGAGEAATPDQ